MNRIAMSQAAAGLLRALIVRAGVSRDRILLTEARSTDWQSLTFVGERHEIHLRVTGADAMSVVQRVVRGLGEAEFSIPGQIVADISVAGELQLSHDGSVTAKIEALTIAE